MDNKISSRLEGSSIDEGDVTRRSRIRRVEILLDAEGKQGGLLPLAACDCDNHTCDCDNHSGTNVCVAGDVQADVDPEIDVCGALNWG